MVGLIAQPVRVMVTAPEVVCLNHTRVKDFSLIADTCFLSRTSKSRGFGEFLSSTLQNTLKT